MRRRFESLVCRNYTCAADDLVCCFGSNVIKELLSTLGKLSILLGYENEGALYYVTTVLNSFFACNNTAYGKCLYGIFNRSERSIADCAGVACTHALVRERLLDMQRDVARKHNVIMDGRDIGSVVLPKADVKFFLTASAEVRARRRFEELQAKGGKDSYEKVLK